MEHYKLRTSGGTKMKLVISVIIPPTLIFILCFVPNEMFGLFLVLSCLASILFYDLAKMERNRQGLRLFASILLGVGAFVISYGLARNDFLFGLVAMVSILIGEFHYLFGKDG